MNSRKAVSKSTNAAADAGGTSSVKGNKYEEYSYEGGNVVQMKDVEIEPNQDADRGLTGKHSINQLGVTAGKGMNASSIAPKARGPSQGTHMQCLGDTAAGRATQNSWPKVINSKVSAGGESSKAQQSDSSWGSWGTAYKVPSAAIHPPLQNGWQWSARAGKPGLRTNTQVKNCNMHPQDDSIALNHCKFDELPQDVDSDIEDDDELLDDSEDDFSDGFDSDDSQKSHDTRKKNKWLKPFFESLDNLNLEQINEQARQWHCPACQGGPGAIDWYTGLQPLMTHAKTKGRMRMRLHRELAELLEEELRRRGTSIIPAGEAFGKWMGLCETTPDHEIVWPPMVVVMNTLLEKDEKDKWKGMGNQELLEYFNTYEAVKARHSYGPNGHRGMSVLIFEASALGYFEAERLHRQFRGEGRDRDAWEKRPTLFYPGGKRQLYGFLASKEDLIIFNQHSHVIVKDFCLPMEGHIYYSVGDGLREGIKAGIGATSRNIDSNKENISIKFSGEVDIHEMHKKMLKSLDNHHNDLGGKDGCLCKDEVEELSCRPEVSVPKGQVGDSGVHAESNSSSHIEMDSSTKTIVWKACLKFDMRSYREMVVNPMKQMSEDNQKLIWLKNKVVKQEQRSKALEVSFDMLSQKLRDTVEENRIVRLRTKIQHEENKEEQADCIVASHRRNPLHRKWLSASWCGCRRPPLSPPLHHIDCYCLLPPQTIACRHLLEAFITAIMDFQEKFVKDQMDKIHKITEDKEKTSKNLSQERAKANQHDFNDSGTNVDCRQSREEEMQKFIPSQLKGVEEFEAERAKLIQSHEEKKIELKQKHLTEEIELGKNFDAELTKLIEKYSLPSSQISSSS
ncbi:hypothetical protein IEQ34_001630 [Dendrobium chrysotoxum]|uniref:Uncharacterized protein n=1 Tax=Dendrobium chrysotoxum TaxID=161865 RepID=A0AAV7HQZ4_DENCH|nr:hypothetical protein IEQ34_001630 [Dendrobium chrysotoxum]